LDSRFCRRKIPGALRFIDEAYKHGKVNAASGEGVELVKETKTGDLTRDVDRAEQGVLFEDDVDNLAAGLSRRLPAIDFNIEGPTRSWRSSFPSALDALYDVSAYRRPAATCQRVGVPA